jgi:hypothetical protein
MQLAVVSEAPPHLVRALKILSQRADYTADAQQLLQELSDITVLVATRFTNDRTAEGLSAAFHLSLGCLSLGLSQAELDDDESCLDFLLQHGAEVVFQQGFRHIKELAALPYCAMLSEFDRDPAVQKINLKALFSELCWADPQQTWDGHTLFARELNQRQNYHAQVQCAQWLRQQHYTGPVKDTELDAHGVIALAIIFATRSGQYIVARTGQKELEQLLREVRKTPPDVNENWEKFLAKLPAEFQPIVQERMDTLRPTIIKKILAKAAIKTLITEIQNHYAANEFDIEYP